MSLSLGALVVDAGFVAIQMLAERRQTLLTKRIERELRPQQLSQFLGLELFTPSHDTAALRCG